MCSLGRWGGRLNSWDWCQLGFGKRRGGVEGGGGKDFEEVGEVGVGEVDVGVGGIFGLWGGVGGLVMGDEGWREGGGYHFGR